MAAFHSNAETAGLTIAPSPVSAAYNFTTPGEGKYTVEASNLFHYVDPATSEAVAIRADAENHVASVAGKLAVAKPTLTKRASFNGCSSSRQTSINSAASAAQSYAASAYSYVFYIPARRNSR